MYVFHCNLKTNAWVDIKRQEKQTQRAMNQDQSDLKWRSPLAFLHSVALTTRRRTTISRGVEIWDQFLIQSTKLRDLLRLNWVSCWKLNIANRAVTWPITVIDSIVLTGRWYWHIPARKNRFATNRLTTRFLWIVLRSPCTDLQCNRH